jgi:hypothetical protein
VCNMRSVPGAIVLPLNNRQSYYAATITAIASQSHGGVARLGRLLRVRRNEEL